MKKRVLIHLPEDKSKVYIDNVSKSDAKKLAKGGPATLMDTISRVNRITVNYGVSLNSLNLIN